MKKSFLIFCLIIFSQLLFSVLREVSQDGSKPYLSIQSAIDSGTNGDSILVYPGLYYETLDYLGKALHIGSLYMTTSDTTYIHNTILDGSFEDAVVTVIGVNSGSMSGFTVQHGFGRLDQNFPGDNNRDGGGLFIQNSTFNLYFCIVENNVAKVAGGIAIINSNIFFSGNIIRYNTAYVNKGGITIGPWDSVNNTHIFDSIHKNSIYLNNASICNEMSTNLNYDLVVPLKKTTIANPDYYYFQSYSENSLTITYDEVAVVEVSADLYVSPDGDNQNSGLTPDDPLRTITYANRIIKSDSLNIRTIHVANGTYSVSNGEKLPIHFKNFVKIIGESMENTIIDGEHLYFSFVGGHDLHYRKWSGDVAIENFKLINGLGSPFISNDLQIVIGRITNGSVKNIIVDNTVEEPYLRTFLGGVPQEKNYWENIQMKMNFNPSSGSLADAIAVSYSKDMKISNFQADGFGSGIFIDFNGDSANKKALISNVLISDCHNYWTWPNALLGSALDVTGIYGYDGFDYDVKVVNSTFTDNSNPYGSIGLNLHVNVDFYNCIFYGNEPNTINLDGRYYHGSSVFKNCLIQNGMNDFYTVDTWDLTVENMLTGNPGFAGTGLYPYALNNHSPCINAGTMDIPDYEFPAYDLAGNPRIYNGQVDIGAYEYQGVPNTETNPVKPSLSVKTYPNPIRFSGDGKGIQCRITADNPENGEIELSIYNSKGQKVKTLIKGFSEKGQFNSEWNGQDEQGRTVSSGVYLVSFRNNQEEKISKLTVIK